MQRYINQLIEDFNKAREDPVPEPDFGETYEEFENAILEIETAEPVSAKQNTGVSYEELPPAEKMTDAQIQNLLEAMLNALSAKGTEVTFPGDGIPVRLAYSELREHFREGFHAMPGWVIDFCSGWCPDCTFADFCTVKDHTWTKEELDTERKKKFM